MLEKPVEKSLLTQCRSRGWLCLKFVSPARNGVPDRIVVAPHAIAFVEVKRPGGEPTAQQIEMHKKLRSRNAQVFIVDSIESVTHFINAFAHPTNNTSCTAAHAAHLGD